MEILLAGGPDNLNETANLPPHEARRITTIVEPPD
jgi:hypothetical protein